VRDGPRLVRYKMSQGYGDSGEDVLSPHTEHCSIPNGAGAKRMDRFFRWVRRNEALGWAGVIVGLIPLIASAQFVGTAVGYSLLGGGGLVVGGTTTAILMARGRKYAFQCYECVQEYTMSGTRGERAHFHENVLLKALYPLSSFPFAFSRADGDLKNQTIRYRNLGKRGRAAAQEIAFHTLGREQLSSVRYKPSGTILHIHPPAPLRKGDVVEIQRDLDATGTFNDDEEFVEKIVMYPTKQLQFKLSFREGAVLRESWGTKFEGDLPVEAGFTPLDAKAEEGNTVVRWPLKGAKPSERYRVFWSWA